MIVGGVSISPAMAGGRRGPHEGPYNPAKSSPYNDSGRTVLARKGRTVYAPAPQVGYSSRPRRARAYNPSVYGPGPYQQQPYGYYDPYAGVFPNGGGYYPAPAYTYDPYNDSNYGRRTDHGRDAVTIVAGTAGGAVVGGMLGGKKGAIMGGVIGAAASTIIASKTKGQRRFPF